MTSEREGGPNVPAERADHASGAGQRPAGGEDRAGFDLGGAADKTGSEGLRNPRSSPSAGADVAGRASGASDLSGSQSLGDEGGAGSDAGGGATDGGGGPG